MKHKALYSLIFIGLIFVLLAGRNSSLFKTKFRDELNSKSILTTDQTGSNQAEYGSSKPLSPGMPITATDDVSFGVDHPPTTQVAWKNTRDRVENDISSLKSETTKDSLTNLKKVTMYFWPGAYPDEMYVLQLPILEKHGRFDVETIMSNRRFAKLLEELEQVGEVSAILLADELRSAFIEYKRMFDQLEKERGPRYLATMAKSNPFAGLSFQIEDGNEDSTLFLGARFRLLTLIFLASQLRLGELHSSIMEIVNYAIAQRDQIYGDTLHHEIYRFELLDKASLYNRQILATAIRLTAGGNAEFSSKMLHTRLPAYDAYRTSYDRGGPVDYSKGELEIQFYPPMNDEEFDNLYRILSR